MSDNSKMSDVCLMLEGTYPYVSGGVASWTHHLITELSELTFSIVCVLPKDADTEMQYDLPANVMEFHTIHLQTYGEGTLRPTDTEAFFDRLKPLLIQIHAGKGGRNELTEVMQLLEEYRGIDWRFLLNSPEAWDTLVTMYEEELPESSFIDYFWSNRALLGGLYSILLADLPKARLYHALSTGYAGVLAARAAIETNRPAIVTEHGIYNNERRVEINMADWLLDDAPKSLALERNYRDLRSLWMDNFSSYSRMCYESCNRILTLYKGNQSVQIEDGAEPSKLGIIPNGVDVEKLGTIKREKHKRPTIAMLARVVPIKDVKTFIRAVQVVRNVIPDIQALIMGSHDEDPYYFDECQQMIDHMALQDSITFTGHVDPRKYFPTIDLMVLTSISEAQPLVILEAGAAGIPTVATNVGACSEMIYGAEDESPALGEGGLVTNLANPSETAKAIISLLTDEPRYAAASKAMKERVNTYYRKTQQIEAYRNLYKSQF